MSNETNVDFVIIDDDLAFLNLITKYLLAGKKVDTYTDPLIFIENIDKYNKNTKLIFDNHYDDKSITGVDLGKKLYNLGYKNLYLLSGNPFKAGEIPEFIIQIIKGNLDHLESVLAIA